jgi:hypothetical protein
MVCKPKTSPYPFTWVKGKNPPIPKLSDAANGSTGDENKNDVPAFVYTTLVIFQEPWFLD